MVEFIAKLFDTNFMPHAMCLGKTDVIWLHVVSDALIATAYALIPFGLLRLMTARKDLTFHWLGGLFALFILSCGATHVMSIVTLWTPVYRLEGVVKAATALASVATAFCLLQMIPRLGQMPSSKQWEAANAELKRQINERKLVEERNSLLAAIVACSDDAIISETLQGIITTWNRGATHTLGHTPFEAIGQHISLIQPADGIQKEQHFLERLLNGETIENFETLRLHKDGRLIPVSVTISPVRDTEGHIIGASKILRDISDRKMAEEKFRMVVESAPNAMVMIDPEGIVTLVNAQTERLFGYHRDEMLGRPVELLVPERFQNIHRGHRAHFFSNPATISPHVRAMGPGSELFGKRRNGTEFPIEVGLNPIQTQDGLMVLSSIIDVTERKQTEEKMRKFNELLEEQVSKRTAQLEAANKDLGEFAYAASHDLKAPLRVIDNASKWLEEDLAEHLTDETRESMEMLRGRVRRMEKLLDDLLEYARIGHVQDNRFVEMVDGDLLVQDIIEMLSPRGFEIRVGAGFAGIHVARMPLQQILMNLISNALKHHHKTTGLIEVTLEDAGDCYQFSVKDDGPGIPKQYHKQIFEMFQTLKPRDQVEGSGMGLAVVRKHLEVFGGRLRLESAEGKGSAFHFSWPKFNLPNGAKL